MAKKHDEDFDLVNLPKAAQDPDIKAEDFTLQQADTTIHEQKFQTKPTTFLKDSLKRFSKNKSSVVASYILGALVLLSIFVPIFNKSDVSTSADSSLKNLEPKLFDSGSGFWDGVKTIKHEPVQYKDGDYYPDDSVYLPGGVSNMVVEGINYTNEANRFGIGGYLQVGFYGGKSITEEYLSSRKASEMPLDESFTVNLSAIDWVVTKFNVCDLDKLIAMENDDKLEFPENFELGMIGLEFCYLSGDTYVPVTVIDQKTIHNIGLDSATYTDTDPINISEIIVSKTGKSTFDDFYFRFKMTKQDSQSDSVHVCSLVRDFVITTTSTQEAEQHYFSPTEYHSYGISGISFNDGMKIMNAADQVGPAAKVVKNTGYWSFSNTQRVVKGVYAGKAVFASFKYDSYVATLGRRKQTVSLTRLNQYKKNGWVDFVIEFQKVGGVIKINKTKWDAFAAEHDGYGIYIINPDKCPIVNKIEFEDLVITGSVGGETFVNINAEVIYYRYLGFDTMPKYLFGTDKSGRDMFKYVFEGLRNSLALGVVTFLVCFLFGLFWGSVSGYFGGAVDMVMERVTDILSGVPWIVVMTLVILKSGKSDFGTFALALCLTGWIGTASTTRTQFYRFRGREYVLASRTLGASDGRLIAKHILPNAMGTIITGAVLMIPSVIFSEATISYLGLGFKNLSSLGVILSSNQNQLIQHPYQLLFPSAVIALVMISFNLFGNGLRDAINPSLKGEDE